MNKLALTFLFHRYREAHGKKIRTDNKEAQNSHLIPSRAESWMPQT